MPCTGYHATKCPGVAARPTVSHRACEALIRDRLIHITAHLTEGGHCDHLATAYRHMQQEAVKVDWTLIATREEALQNLLVVLNK